MKPLFLFLKNIIDKILGTIIGPDGEGSAKRMSMFNMMVLISIVHLVYAWCYRYIVIHAIPGVTPNVIHTEVISQFDEFYIIDCVLFLTLAGYAVIESITNLVQVFKNSKTEKSNI